MHLPHSYVCTNSSICAKKMGMLNTLLRNSVWRDVSHTVRQPM